MHIYIVTDEMVSPHGTEMLTALVIGEAIRRGWAVTLFTALFDPRSGPWPKFLRECKVPVHHPGFWFLTRFHLPHRIIARLLWRKTKHERPDLIWASSQGPLVCHALLAKPAMGAPPFFVHDANDASESVSYLDLWFRACTRVSALSASGERQARRAEKRYKVSNVESVWLSSLPPEREVTPPRTSSPIRFGQFGRLWDMKNPGASIEALSMLRDAGIDAELHFFGAGPLMGQCRAMVSRLRMEDSVYFHGSYDWSEIDGLVEQIDVGLMPSLYEGFGIVMVELMARGRPVISYRVGSSEDILGKYGTGWVVASDTVTELAQIMKYCCMNPREILSRGELARTVWRQHFTPEKMFDRLIKFWSSRMAQDPVVKKPAWINRC